MKMKLHIFAITFASLVITNIARADDDDIRLTSLPASVQETIQDNLRGGRVDDIDRIQIEGRTMYKVEVELQDRDDDDLKLYIAGDGALLKTREELRFNELPSAVQDAARKFGGKVDDVEKEVSQGKISYHIEVDRDDDKSGDNDLKIVFAEDGSILSQRSDD